MSKVIRQILDDAEVREPVAIESVWNMIGIGDEGPNLIGEVPIKTMSLLAGFYSNC